MNPSIELSHGMPPCPVADFAAFFKLRYDNKHRLSFTAIINCSSKDGAQKLDAKIHISSENLPMDTIWIEAEQAASAGVPPVLQAGQDVFSYLPGEFLMIKGKKEQYGQYNILLYPKMITVVME